MKMTSRLIALLLCAAMLLGMIGCTQSPAETVPPTEPPTEAPTEPPATDLYAQAYSNAQSASELVLNITSVQTTTVAGQMFTENTEQTIYYSGLGTEALQFRSDETISYSEDQSLTYEEIYTDGMLYTLLDYTHMFSGELTAEEAALRHPNALMLDSSLYGGIAAEVDGAGYLITFTQPTAAESWAMPKDAEMTDASASAMIGADGNLQSMHYSLRYQHGPAQITLELDATLSFNTVTVAKPSNADDYILLDDVDALNLAIRAAGALSQSTSVTTSSLESVMTQAAGVVRNQSTGVDYYKTDDDFIAKIKTGVYLMDYSTNQSQKVDQEEVYLDGKYTVTVDNGVPTTQTGDLGDAVATYCDQLMNAHVRLQDYKYWKDAVITDLDSMYLIELNLSEDFGNDMQNTVCTMFWADPGFLNKLADAYVNNETTGYLSVDKYTGLPIAAGVYFEGTHTIEGSDYVLTLQYDQSIDGASMESYHTITEEMLPEAEPETKATPLFYHVTGDDGQEMWLFGTIHVGDERTAYLPQEIYDALSASDALALEYYSNGFDEKMEEDEKLQEQVSNMYYYSDGSTAEDHMEPELYELALKQMKATGNYNMNTPYMKPSIWSQSIENFYLRQGYHLTNNQGVESRLEKLAEDQGKEIRDIESAVDQIKMLTGWSEELQEVLLEDTSEIVALEYVESVADLYEKWCAGDEAVLREELSDEVDTSELTEEELAEYEAQKHLLEEYNKAMSYDRNDGMLKVAIKYLESDDVVFYAVGLAHLLNDVNGLVDALREAGYTVELVKFAQ